MPDEPHAAIVARVRGERAGLATTAGLHARRAGPRGDARGLATPAQATVAVFCDEYRYPGEGCQASARHSLRYSLAANVHNVNRLGASAHCAETTCGSYIKYQRYGNEVYGSSQACHSYAGTYLLWAAAANAGDNYGRLAGWHSYGTGAPTCS